MTTEMIGTKFSGTTIAEFLREPFSPWADAARSLYREMTTEERIDATLDIWEIAFNLRVSLDESIARAARFGYQAGWPQEIIATRVRGLARKSVMMSRRYELLGILTGKLQAQRDAEKPERFAGEEF